MELKKEGGRLSELQKLFATDMERMKQRWPDVLVLDVEMPRMDGLATLERLMEQAPTPVVMVKHMIAVAAVVEAGEKLTAGTEVWPMPPNATRSAAASSAPRAWSRAATCSRRNWPASASR